MSNKTIRVGDLVFHSTDKGKRDKSLYIVLGDHEWYDNYVVALCCATNSKKTWNSRHLMKLNA